MTSCSKVQKALPLKKEVTELGNLKDRQTGMIAGGILWWDPYVSDTQLKESNAILDPSM